MPDFESIHRDLDNGTLQQNEAIEAVSAEVQLQESEVSTSEADEFAQLLSVQEGEDRDMPSPALDASGSRETDDQSLENKTKELSAKESSKTKIVSLQESESRAVASFPPAERIQMRIDFKAEFVNQQREEGRKHVAESTVLFVPSDTQQRRQEKVEERNAIEQDLQNMQPTTDEFYKEYFAVLKGDAAERPMRMRMLESSLGESLRGAGENAYSDEKIHEIFLALTSTQEVERMSVILYVERMRKALEIAQRIDKKAGHHNASQGIQDAMQEVFHSDLSPEKKLEAIDNILHRLSQLKTNDKGLQEQLNSLSDLNKFQDEANGVLEMQLIEDQMTVETHREEAILISNTIKTDFPEMPEPDIQFLTQSVEAGRFELVSAMLKEGTVKKQLDGSYMGTVEGEMVSITERDGKVVAYLGHGSEHLFIPLTDPSAVGFDLARSEKIAKIIECDDLCAREDIRWALMDNPGDRVFMNKQEADKFQAIVQVVAGKQGSPVEPALRSLSLLRENRTVDGKYMNALKLCFNSWAPDSNFLQLVDVVTQRDLQALVKRWKKEETDRAESQTLNVYTLEQIREPEFLNDERVLQDS